MNPIVHGELAWLALAQPLRERRDRNIVAWAGVAPDLDGITLLAYPFDGGAAYSHYHHLLTHSLPAGLAMGALAYALASPGAKARTAALAFLAFHLHLLCDLLGSGAMWPIFYLYPFSDWTLDPFSFGWELQSWQNGVIGAIATFAVLGVGAWQGRTLFEVFSARWDGEVVKVLRKWAGRAPEEAPKAEQG